MSIKIKNALRDSLSRAVLCLLILLPMGVAMAASKPAPKPNPLLQNPAQPGYGYASPYTTQNGVATPGALAVPVAQSPATASGASATGAASTKNATTTRGTSQNTGGGGGV